MLRCCASADNAPAMTNPRMMAKILFLIFYLPVKGRAIILLCSQACQTAKSLFCQDHLPVAMPRNLAAHKRRLKALEVLLFMQ
ncbi:MAG: hypothetical protein CVV41_05200 [Candidatus Riflebacteria bacterium HGW-Riflebacteria-1]|nr:MAG: hypothetical protein CVV41_05200 [Candidatus Riflebacteria bacterium HGW-Riflebacteria-1]